MYEKKTTVLSLGLLAAALYSVVVSRRKPKISANGKEIPIPKQGLYPYIGHMFSLGTLPSKKMTEWHNELGPIIKLKMGIQTWISVDDPELAHKIFVTNGSQTSYRPHSTYAYHYYSLRGKGIGAAQPGDGWREARSAVLSILAPKKMDHYIKTIDQQSDSLTSRLLEKGTVNPYHDLELYALNNIMSTCFDKTFPSVNDPDFIELTDMINLSISLAGLDKDLANFIPVFAIFEYLAGTRATMNNFIQAKRDPIMGKYVLNAQKSENPNFVKALKLNGYDMPLQDLIILLFDVIGGGSDTTSATLSWDLVLLCKFPDVQERCAQEINAFVEANGRLPTFEERLQVPYCISVIKECMRFRPTTSFGLPHSVYEDVEVDGYIIPKGATLLTNMDSLHKNERLYPEPEEFMPERFADNLKSMLASANGKLEERDHFNFGWGRRICPAIHLAELEVFSAFVNILSRCVIEPADSNIAPDVNDVVNVGLNRLPAPCSLKFFSRY